MSENGRSVPPIPSVPGGVPIIGAAVYMACSQGHVEQTVSPFTIVVPSGGGPMSDPIPLYICRVCWLNFVRMFGARPLTAEEIEEFRASGALEGQAV